jgi:hypothetical protein
MRSNRFKKGHVPYISERSENLQNQTSGNRTFQRLTKEDATDVYHLCHDNDNNTMPYKLRPRPEKKNETINNEVDENIIVNVTQLQLLLQSVHHCKSPTLKMNIKKRQGLHITMSAKCKGCKMVTPNISLSDTMTNKRGPPTGALNKMLVLPIMKSKVGIDDVGLVLSCLNIKPPSHTCIQKHLNNLSDRATTLNQKSMIENQQHIKHVTTLAGKESMADIQFDVSFSRRPRGGFEAAQQSFGVAIDHSTTRPLPIATAIANKHCHKPKCSHTVSNCKKTYNSDLSIASSERTLLHQSLDNIRGPGILKIRSVTTDASSQLAKALRDYRSEKNVEFSHFKCFVHRLRTLEKNIRVLKLTSIPRKYLKSIYMQKLGASIRARVRLELQNLKATKQKGHNFVHRGCLALKYITRCLSGYHRFCREHSTVCIHHLKHYSTKSLPYGVHLQLNNCDLNTVQAEINKIFSVEGLQNLSELFNTNMCESLHASVYNLAPKSTCWSRNFAGLCHSATHSRTVGQGVATLLLAKAAGIKMKSSSQMYVQLKQQDKLRKYHTLRKASTKYKTSRYFLRKRVASRLQYQNSLYSDNRSASEVSSEHNYGLAN